MIEAWQLVKARYAGTALSGEGARRYGGRFNSVGTAVVYAAASLALAELELLVNLPTEKLLGTYCCVKSGMMGRAEPVRIGLTQHYVAFRLRFDDALVEMLPLDELPAAWRRSPAPQSVKTIGDRWVQAGRSLVLTVPSAVVPWESNVLINPNHPAVEHLEVSGPLDPQIDPRLR